MSYKSFHKKIIQKLTEDSYQKLKLAGMLLERSIKDSMRESSAGGRPRSQPGEVPHVEHGDLKQKIDHETDRATLTSRTGTNLPYGKHLELGAPKANLKARPFIRPAVERERKNLIAIFAKPIKG